MKNTTMLNCSYWAKSHPKSAIFIIAMSKIMIALFALFLGIAAYFEGWMLEPSNWRIILLIIAASCLLLYPSKSLKAKWGIVRYHRNQKGIDACLVAFGMVFWFFIGNGLPSWVKQPTASRNASAFVSTALSVAGQHDQAPQTSSLKQGGMFKEWLIKKAKSKMKRVIERIERLEGKNTELVAKVLFTLLFLVLMIGLGYLTIYSGCNIACAGQEVLGTIVMIGGPIAALVFGTILIIKIWKKKKVSVNQSAPKPN